MKNNPSPTVIADITAIAYGGDGVARLPDGMICFVPGTIPPERVKIRITCRRRNFCRGEVLEVIIPAPARIEPPCPHFAAKGKMHCPGCTALMMDYPTELEWKSRQFSDFLLRRQLCSAECIAPICPSPRRLGTRNKLKLHSAGNGKYGYIAADNRTVIPIKKCLLAQEEINRYLEEHPMLHPCGTTITLRVASDEQVICFSGKKDAGNRLLTENLGSFGKFTVPAASFFQTNSAVAEMLIKECVQHIAAAGCREMVELYCGTGIFSIAAAEHIPTLRCHGVEIDSAGIECAGRNAEVHQVSDRCTFAAGDAACGIGKAASLNNKILLIDPPRTGVNPETLDGIIAADPALLIYISCGPDTLQRDLVRVCAAGFTVQYARAFDMFPATGHFESLVILSKKQPGM